MIKIIQLEKMKDSYGICIETENFYQFLSIDSKDDIQKLISYKKSKYKNRQYFIDILSKFDPKILFLIKPINVKELTYFSIQKSTGENK